MTSGDYKYLCDIVKTSGRVVRFDSNADPLADAIANAQIASVLPREIIDKIVDFAREQKRIYNLSEDMEVKVLVHLERIAVWREVLCSVHWEGSIPTRILTCITLFGPVKLQRDIKCSPELPDWVNALAKRSTALTIKVT